MSATTPVVYSFGLYILYVVLPLIPAVVIFLLFPEDKVQVTGPLANLTVKATGAFAAYVVTAILGVLVVQNIEKQIILSRTYPFEGIITSLSPDQAFNYSGNFYAKELPDGPNSKDYYFVIMLTRPVDAPQKVYLQYWQTAPSGSTIIPPPKMIPMEILPTDTYPERFRLLTDHDELKIVPESKIDASTTKNIGFK